MYKALNKEEVLSACRKKLAAQKAVLLDMFATSREAANNETKSSAGDKFETTRALMHAEQEKLSGQLEAINRQHATLQQVEQSTSKDSIGLGSLVKTQTATYFIAIGLGKLAVNGQDVLCISAASPIGQLLMGKKKDDVISFNEREQEIIQVI